MERLPDHPVIRWMERTGYPSWMQDEDIEEEEDDDEASA